MARLGIKMSFVPLEKFYFCFVVLCVIFKTSVVIKIILFSFRVNGLKSNYFCGELSHVSVLLAILCLYVFTTSAMIQLLLLCANISRLWKS